MKKRIVKTNSNSVSALKTKYTIDYVTQFINKLVSNNVCMGEKSKAVARSLDFLKQSKVQKGSGFSLLRDFFTRAMPRLLLNEQVRGRKKKLIPYIATSSKLHATFLKELVSALKQKEGRLKFSDKLMEEATDFLEHKKGKVFENYEARYELAKANSHLTHQIHTKQIFKSNIQKNALKKIKFFYI